MSDGALSPREREVLGLIGSGLTGREIAEALGISARTVETHRARLMSKLSARGTSQLTKWAIKLRLTSGEP